MVWNPFQYQFTATYVSDEGDEAILELKKGTVSEILRFPRHLLPHELQIGSAFLLKVEDSETGRNSEAEALKRLLNELIR